MAAKSSSLTFTVRRSEPELLPPAKPTPHDYKPLSDIDDQESLRFQMPIVLFYQNNPAMLKDPVSVIKVALTKALVFYYPFAGRLREIHNRKLVVECTGEGVLFIEADADVTLAQFGDDHLKPPFPCMEELLYDVPGSAGILNSPLLLIQVTRLRCGGFILAIRFNHTMSDASGLAQFLNAAAEIARGGVHTPTILPVWCREVLHSRNPPNIKYAHREYAETVDVKGTLPKYSTDYKNMIHSSFSFGLSEVSALRKLLSPHLRQSCTTFDLLAAVIWRCRTIALQPDLDEEMRFVCLMNARSRLNPNTLPLGYYGNVFALPVAVTTAKELQHNPLDYVVELLQKTKAQVTNDYVKSMMDFLVNKGRPPFSPVQTLTLSSLMNLGLETVDFGWGEAVYVGPTGGDLGPFQGVINFFIPSKNKKGEKVILVPIYLTASGMDRFVKELRSLLKHDHVNSFSLIISPL